MQESKFQMVGKPKLKEVNFSSNSDFSFEGALNIDLDFDIEINRFVESDGQDENEILLNEAIVQLTIKLFKSIDFDEAPFVATVSIEGLFEWDTEINANGTLIDTLLNQNAPAILLSFIRPLITTLTVDASLPPLIIPMMDFTRN